MASGNLKTIKRRMKSVNSTMKITKAMELIASSKLKRAKDKLQQNKPYFETIYDTIMSIAQNNTDMSTLYTKETTIENSLYVVISGDRGLAGGYNSGVMKLALSKINKENDKIIAFGNKCKDSFLRNNYNVIYSDTSDTSDISIHGMTSVSKVIIDLFNKKQIGNVYVIYTDFVTSLTQEPIIKKVLPINIKASENDGEADELITYEPSASVVFENIVPNYISGVLFGALIDSFACEQSARRNAMESANDNAKDIIEKLDLLYNRARQSAITQEISEIVGGAEALN
ncbi:MAG: ATP synthase F1 subunit gamma [Oscillospiraceae bacterium]